MYQELEKYRTGNKLQGKANIASFGNEGRPQQIDWEYDEYQAGLGDLIDDYIKHERKPWYRKSTNHDHMSNIYRKFLNQIKITQGL